MLFQNLNTSHILFHTEVTDIHILGCWNSAGSPFFYVEPRHITEVQNCKRRHLNKNIIKVKKLFLPSFVRRAIKPLSKLFRIKKKKDFSEIYTPR